MVDVQHHALSAFEHDVLAGGVGFHDEGGSVGKVGHEAGSESHEVFEDLFRIEGFHAVELGEEHVLLFKGLIDLGLEHFGIGKVASAHAHAGLLVLVAGADAAAGGTDLVLGLAFTRGVDGAVIRHDEMGLVADLEAFGAHIETESSESVDLFEEAGGVEHDAVADDAHLAGMKNTGRHHMQDVLLSVNDDGMARVVAALETDHHIHFGSEQIDDLAFAFVAPLRTNDSHVRHKCLLGRIFMGDGWKTRSPSNAPSPIYKTLWQGRQYARALP